MRERERANQIEDIEKIEAPTVGLFRVARERERELADERR